MQALMELLEALNPHEQIVETAIKPDNKENIGSADKIEGYPVAKGECRIKRRNAAITRKGNGRYRCRNLVCGAASKAVCNYLNLGGGLPGKT